MDPGMCSASGMQIPQSHDIQSRETLPFTIPECSDKNYLEVRDGYWHRSKLLARLCGARTHLPPIVSTGSRMLITYKTAPNSAPQTGFVASYEGAYSPALHPSDISQNKADEK